jgi:hypothetical protein
MVADDVVVGDVEAGGDDDLAATVEPVREQVVGRSFRLPRRRAMEQKLSPKSVEGMA